MDQIEKMPPLKSNDVQSFERFADLVRIAVVKLQAEGCGGEFGDGALHSLLVKKFADCQVVSYSRWLRENKKDRSVFSLRDWLKEEVRIQVEAVELAHGIEAETVGAAMDSGKHVDKGGRIRSSVKAITLVRNQQCLQANHRVCTVEETMECGVADVFRTWESTNVGMSQGINDFVFVAWQVITKEELVPRLDLVTLMVVKEIIITYCMASHKVT